MAKLSPCSGAACLAAGLLASGCGGGSGSSFPSNVTITVSPTLSTIPAGTTQQFTATVTGYSAAPSWGVEPTATTNVGSITQQGLYTAPAVPPIVNYGGFTGTQGTVKVFASEIYPAPNMLFGSVVSAQQEIIVTAPSVITGFYTSTATVPLGGTFKFQPYAVGAVNRAYTLQVQGVTGGSTTYGTISQDTTNAGLYTAPAAMPMTGKTVTVTVISAADPSKSANATVTLQ